MRRCVLALLTSVVGLAIVGCNSEEMRLRNKENEKKWNEFWDKQDSGGGLFGRRGGDFEIWTIECNAFRGPQHVETADTLATALKKVRQLRADRVRVEHGVEESRVSYSEYKLKYVEAKVDSESHAKGDVHIELSDEIKRDLSFIKSLALGEKHPFFSARTIPKPSENVGPPEWDLRNAKGAYTLHVGVTYNMPTLHNYKEAAVEWVKALREDGHEAYFYHHAEKPRSDICVGTFGEDAVTEYTETIKDPESGETRQVPRKRLSEAVHTLRNQADFRFNLENGCKIHRAVRNEKTGEEAKMANESFLVKIPRPEGSGDVGRKN